MHLERHKYSICTMEERKEKRKGRRKRGREGGRKEGREGGIPSEPRLLLAESTAVREHTALSPAGPTVQDQLLLYLQWFHRCPRLWFLGSKEAEGADLPSCPQEPGYGHAAWWLPSWSLRSAEALRGTAVPRSVLGHDATVCRRVQRHGFEAPEWMVPHQFLSQLSLAPWFLPKPGPPTFLLTLSAAWYASNKSLFC